MARITIVGSGVVGLAIAAHLSKIHEVTVIARNLPGDEKSVEWASPLAGANFVPGFCTSTRERKMQRETFAQLWMMAIRHPESSVKKIQMDEYFDQKRTADEMWYGEYMPNFQPIPQEQLPEDTAGGVTYTSVVLNPDIFLPWMKRRLEKTGIKFRRLTLDSLSDARHLGHDILINASGLGPKDMSDVQDKEMVFLKGQIMIVKSNYRRAFMRDDGKTYTYVIPRLDGSVILGGVREPDISNMAVIPEIDQDIVKRVNKSLPQHFSASLEDHDIVGHNVGIRPYRKEMRIENEIIEGQNIVHAYGITGGGYIFGFGVAREVIKLVDEILDTGKLAKL